MIYSIQAYRGFAAILVLLHHSTLLVSDYFNIKDPFLSIFYGGNSGVQFFFVLSGFIIYFIHKKDIGRPSTLLLYLTKRFVRVYPIYFAVTIVVVSLYFIIPSFGEDYYRTFKSIIVSFFLVPYTKSPHVDVAWTLVHEVFFYLVFAVLIINKKIGWALVFLLVFSILINILYLGSLSYPWSFLLSPYNLLFFLGIFAAFLIERQMYNVNRHKIALPIFFISNSIMIVSIFVYGLFYFYLEKEINTTLMIVWFGLGSFFIILQSGNSKLESYFKKKKLLLLIGESSYSLYLLHYLVITFLMKILVYLNISNYISIYLVYAFLIISGVVSGILLHLFIEKPLLSIFKKSLLK